jgi:hypothetical protein
MPAFRVIVTAPGFESAEADQYETEDRVRPNDVVRVVVRLPDQPARTVAVRVVTASLDPLPLLTVEPLS